MPCAKTWSDNPTADGLRIIIVDSWNAASLYEVAMAVAQAPSRVKRLEVEIPATSYPEAGLQQLLMVLAFRHGALVQQVPNPELREEEQEEAAAAAAAAEVEEAGMTPHMRDRKRTLRLQQKAARKMQKQERQELQKAAAAAGPMQLQELKMDFPISVQQANEMLQHMTALPKLSLKLHLEHALCVQLRCTSAALRCLQLELHGQSHGCDKLSLDLSAICDSCTGLEHLHIRSAGQVVRKEPAVLYGYQGLIKLQKLRSIHLRGCVLPDRRPVAKWLAGLPELTHIDLPEEHCFYEAWKGIAAAAQQLQEVRFCSMTLYSILTTPAVPSPVRKLMLASASCIRAPPSCYLAQVMPQLQELTVSADTFDSVAEWASALAGHPALQDLTLKMAGTEWQDDDDDDDEVVLPLSSMPKLAAAELDIRGRQRCVALLQEASRCSALRSLWLCAGRRSVLVLPPPQPSTAAAGSGGCTHCAHCPHCKAGGGGLANTAADAAAQEQRRTCEIGPASHLRLCDLTPLLAAPAKLPKAAAAAAPVAQAAPGATAAALSGWDIHLRTEPVGLSDDDAELRGVLRSMWAQDLESFKYAASNQGKKAEAARSRVERLRDKSVKPALAKLVAAALRGDAGAGGDAGKGEAAGKAVRPGAKFVIAHLGDCFESGGFLGMDVVACVRGLHRVKFWTRHSMEQ